MPTRRGAGSGSVLRRSTAPARCLSNLEVSELYEHVLAPIVVGGVTLRNRVVRTAHGTHLRFPSREEPVSPLVAYHLERARGGVALSILEAVSIDKDVPGPNVIPLWSDDVVAGYERLVEAVKPHGMKLFQQLWHGGHCQPQVNGQAPWSASDVPNPRGGRVPIPMTKAMIDDVVGKYAAAAARVRRGGLDGVEVHAAHGYLPAQFFSPTMNTRDDEYGGPLENRVRFCIEVLQAIRAEVDAGFPIGVRLSADEEYAGGLRVDDAIAIAPLLEPHIDYLNISIGSYHHLHMTDAPMDEPLGYELPKTVPVAQVVDVPTIVVGRIMTLEHADRLIAEGMTDMVSIVRALIADPELVNKARDGREAEIRPCIGSSQGCLGGEEGHLCCVVNPSAGFERSVPVTIPSSKTRRRFLVAGGGPAGMEAARVLASGGHEVHLAEMTSQLGGQVTIAASAPYRADVGAVGRWLADEIGRLGVHVMLRTFVDPDLVADLAPDALIVATGSTPRRDGFQSMRPALELPGAARSHVYTSWDVLGFGGRAEVGAHSVVYDDPGGYEAICVCEKLLEAGGDVTLVSRWDRYPGRVPGSRQIGDMTAGPARERLLANPRFSFVSDSCLLEIGDTDVEVALVHPPTGRPTRRMPADTVVMVGFNHPNRELADALAGGRVPVHLVGDAAGSVSLRSAIRDASLLARDLVGVT
jgi:2,4-dienoyl-CoA reductase-like NADH-dependent reductase (Old Yellow Enzyme family)